MKRWILGTIIAGVVLLICADKLNKKVEKVIDNRVVTINSLLSE